MPGHVMSPISGNGVAGEVRPISRTQVATFKRRFALAAGLILTTLTGLGFWVAVQA